MKQLLWRLVFVLPVTLSAAAFADDVPGKFQGIIGSRCDQQQQMTPAECADTQERAKAEGCIDEGERSWLHTRSYSIFCVGRRPIFVCPCSCFDAPTQIMTGTFSNPVWKDAKAVLSTDHVVSLVDAATLDGLVADPDSAWLARDLYYTTSGPEHPDLYVFQLSNGRELAVSQHHALLLSDGRVLTAKELAPRQELLSPTGEAVTITAISRRQAADGKVYNFLIRGESRASHLVIAEGVIVGDTMWQGSWENLVGEIAVRRRP